MKASTKHQVIKQLVEQKLPLDEHGLNLLFREARTHNGWLDRPVQSSVLRELWELVKFAPTAVNSMPARILFITTRESKERLKSCLSPGNIEKSMMAPVTALIGYDSCFWQQLSYLFPNDSVQATFREYPEHGDVTAFRNSCLQGAWLILAARALGLDCGPMSGFDPDAIDREFFKGSTIHSNFLCNIGYGDDLKLYPRLPRLEFDEACTIL